MSQQSMKNNKETTELNRREFMSGVSGLAVMGALGGAGIGAPAIVQAQSAMGYKAIEPAMPTQKNDGSVEVLEFFWFGCPHCYAFEPAINSWADTKPEYVNFVREAPPLNPSWEQHSRTYYAAQALGIDSGMFDQMFDQIHQKKRPMRNPKKIGVFIESLDLGVDAKKFIKTMDSFTVNTALNRSLVRARQAGINAVPSMVINGKYLTGSSLAGSHEGIINVINELVEQEHKA